MESESRWKSGAYSRSSHASSCSVKIGFGYMVVDGEEREGEMYGEEREERV